MLLLQGEYEDNVLRDFEYSTVDDVFFHLLGARASWGSWWRVTGVVECLGTGVPCPFWWWGLFGDEAVGEETVVLVVADDEVIEEVDVEDVASLDEFYSYIFDGSAW